MGSTLNSVILYNLGWLRTFIEYQIAVNDLILALDVGTQSARAMLFDLRGELIAKARTPMTPYYSTQPGYAEQDPAYFWDSLASACRALWQMTPDAKAAVRGVALTTQRGTVIPLDADGEPLRPAISWLDQRRAEGVRPVGGLWGLAFRLVGMSGTVAYMQAEAEANWLAQNEPETLANTHKFVLLSGYLTRCLTGQIVDSVACQVGYVPFDYKALRWAAPSDWKWNALPLRRDQMPDLVPPGGILGEISAQAAAQSGIPAGLPLIAAAADKACEVLGAGGLTPEIGCIGYGTTATINMTFSRYVEAIPMIPPYPAAMPGAYTLETQITRGYWMVDWFKREFGEAEQRAAAERGIAPETLFDSLAASAPPGAAGLILQPFWSPGIKSPGPEARGAITGFDGRHGRAHLYRAILEGIAYALRDASERAERRSGVRLKELRVAGGGSQSVQAMQITADIFGLPAAQPHVYEASGLGAAIDAAVGLGLHRDFPTAIREMTRIGRVYEPDSARHSLYNDLFERVYKRLYSRLRPLYRNLQHIIG